MKILSRISVFLIFSIALMSCGKQKEVKTVISVQVNGDEDLTAKMSFYQNGIEDSAMLSGNTYTYYPTLKEGNYFVIISPQRGRLKVYVNPGDSLHISVANSILAEPVFTGDNAEVNNYLFERDKLERNMRANFQQITALEEADFLEKLEVEKSNFTNLFDSIASKIKDERFAKFEKARADFEFAEYRLNYPNYHAYVNRLQSFNVSDGYNNYFETLNLKDSTLANLKEFDSFVNSYIDNLAQKEVVYAPEIPINQFMKDYSLKKLALIQQKTDVQAIIDNVSKNVIKEYVSQLGSEANDEVYQNYLSVSKNEAHKGDIKKELDSWALLAEGAVAPVIEYPNAEGEMISTESFKGKLVYVDVWATWCGPCIAEIPSLKALEEKYHNADVVFLSVSVDEERDYQKWKDFVANRELKGVQLYAKGWSKIAKDYKIMGIPRFMLFDKEGKIITVNAARPSGGADELLARHLEAIS